MKCKSLTEKNIIKPEEKNAKLQATKQARLEQQTMDDTTRINKVFINLAIYTVVHEDEVPKVSLYCIQCYKG